MSSLACVLHKVSAGWLVAGALAGLFVILSGPLGHSNATADEPPAKPAPAKEATPEKAAESAAAVKDVLDRVVAKYREAKTYRDSGKVVFVAHDDKGGETREEFQLHVEFERPNHLRLEFQPVRPQLFEDPSRAHVLFVADGEHIFAKREGYGGQVLVADAPETLVAEDLYQDANLIRVLPDGLPDASPLGMIAASAPLELLLSSDGALGEFDWDTGAMLKPSRIDGRLCDRVEFPDAEEGSLVMWIDQQTSIVRRVQYPLAKLLAELRPRGVTSLSLTAEFDGATLNPKIDKSRFAWSVNRQDHHVQQLIDPPNPAEAPSKLLGKPIPDFQFAAPEKEKRHSKTLAGKITVIDVWAFACTTCPEQLPQFDAVRAKFADNDKVQFLALNIDEKDITNEDTEALLTEDLKVDVPSVRLATDPKKFRAAIGLPDVPGIIVLDKQGRVQAVDYNTEANVEETLSPVIEALVAGDDLAKKANDAWQERQKEYSKQISDATVDPPAVTAPSAKP